MQQCTTSGCDNPVSKPGFKLCLQCWKAQKQQGRGGDKVKDNDNGAKSTLTATDIGKHFGLKAARVNLLLSELGWIVGGAKGAWTTTPAGEKMGAMVVRRPQGGVPFVVWNPSVLKNNILIDAVKEYRGDNATQGQGGDAKADTTAPSSSLPSADDFRTKFPATFRTTDGHYVRSRAEVMIDNYLYAANIVHAFERKVHQVTEEDMFCDFYLPEKKVYIEFWGMENDPKYRRNMERKVALYKKYNLNLIELRDNDLQNLDDRLSDLLRKFDITVD